MWYDIYIIKKTKGDNKMKELTIIEGVTLYLTEKTFNAIFEYETEMAKLLKWQELSYEERDWEDYEYYDSLMWELENKFAWLWGNS